MRFLAALFLVAVSASAQNAFVLSLDGDWKYRRDDRPEFAQPSHDDSTWQTFRLPRGTRTPPRDPDSINSVYWMRRTVELPESALGQPLTLSIGIPDGFAEVYVNGSRVSGPITMDTLELAPINQPASFDLPPGVPAVRTVIALRLRAMSLSPTLYLPDIGPYVLASRDAAPRGAARSQLNARYVQYSPALLFSGALATLGIVSLLFWIGYRQRTELLWFSLWTLCQSVVIAARLLPLVFATQEFSHDGRALRLQLAIALIPPLGMVFTSRALGERNVVLKLMPWIAAGGFYVVAFLNLPVEWSPDHIIFVTGVCELIATARAALKGMRLPDTNRWEILLWALFSVMGISHISPFVQGLLSSGLEAQIQRSLPIGPYRVAPGQPTSLLIGMSLMILLLRRVAADRREQERLSSELEAARTVQQLLLPASTPANLEAVYLPAAEVGGDFWHVFDNRLIVVGDVSGKGLKAAMIVSLVTGALRNRRSEEPAAILAELNAVLLGSPGFVTCCVARLDGDSVTLANAGHPSPYLDGRELELTPGLPLGIAPDADYDEVTIPLTGALTFLSDGVIEAANAQGELFGFARTRSISTQSAQEIADAAKQWGQNDDITVVTVRRGA